LARAQTRVDSPVPYSQSKYYAGYRTDCSGYVSMCWSTGTSWATSTFHAVTSTIATAQLKPGDAMLKKGYHIRLFYGWADDAHTQYIAYESNGGVVAKCRVHDLAYDLTDRYVPTRYDHITDSPKPRNVLRDGTFNVWAVYWAGLADQPVWWQASGRSGQTLLAHRMDVYHSARNALTLSNASTRTGTYTELSQSAPIMGGVDYCLSAWAKAGSDPHGVTLKLQYLNAAGDSLTVTTTAGDTAGLVGSAFTRMSILSATPTDAVRALVTVRLAGGTSVGTTGTVSGTSVTLDDISLERPQVTAGIKASATTARSGKTVVLSGSVTPTAAIGVRAVLYMQKPGGSWRKLSSSRVYASGSSAAWKGKVKFTRSWRKGTYRFKTTIPAVPGYLGTTTSSASVKLK
jgi:hypothetical protein